MYESTSTDGFRTTPGALPDEAAGYAAAGGSAQESSDYGSSLRGSSATNEQLMHMIDTAMERRDAWMLGCRNQVRAHPMSTVVAAFVAGMLFDRLSRGRRS